MLRYGLGDMAGAHIIELDGSQWSERWDFWRALRQALLVRSDHALNFAAVDDSVFYYPDELKVRPPLRVIVRRPSAVALTDVQTMATGWAEVRAWKREHYGDDVDASIVIETE